MSAPERKKIPRIVTFDLLRGFFLIAIIIDHIGFFPNYLDWWGMRGLLLSSTAEGFFLISGIILGIVRGAKLVEEPFKKVAVLVLKRALTLYVTATVLVIGFTLIGWHLFPGNPNLKYGIMESQNFLRLAWETLTFQYIYGWADYLRLYAIFIAISPLALWLLRRGLWYVVLGASFLVWLAFPIDFHALSWETVELLQPVAWQLIFFVGLVVGFHWPDITAWWEKHRRLLVPYVAAPLIVIATVTFFWNVFSVFANEFIVTNAWTQMLSDRAWELRLEEFHKESLPLARFALFMLWFWTAFLVVRRFEKPIVRFTGWLLLPFGTNSLYVYTLHAVIVFFVHLYFVETVPVLNLLVVTGTIALIYVAVRTKFLFGVIPR